MQERVKIAVLEESTMVKNIKVESRYSITRNYVVQKAETAKDRPETRLK